MEQFNRKHFAIIVIPLTVPFVKTYSSILINMMGRDTWITLLIACILLFFFSMFILTTMNNNHIYNLEDIYKIGLGRYVGNFFIFLLCISLCLTVIEASGSLSSILHTNLLIETPILFFLTIIYLASVYVSYKTTYVVISVNVIFIGIIIFAGIMLSILTVPYKDYARLKPILVDGFTLDFFHSIIINIGSLSTFFISTFYIPFIYKKNKLQKPVLLALLFCTQVVLFATIGQISTFQIDRLKNMYYPALLQTQLISQFKIAESGELFVMLQIVGGWILRLSITLHVIYLMLKRHINQNTLKGKLLMLLPPLLLFILTNLLAFNVMIWFKFIKLAIYNSFVQYFIFPILIFFIFSVRNKKST